MMNKPIYEMTEEEKNAFIREFIKDVSEAMQPIVLSMADVANRIANAVPQMFNSLIESGLIDSEKYLREADKERKRKRYQRMMERRKSLKNKRKSKSLTK